jgi:hypothetical protein
MPALPLDPVTGQLVPYTADQIAAMGIRRRGVDGTADPHVRYNFSPNGTGCTRRFSCLWSQRFDALFYFVGAAALYGTPRKLSRLVPQRDPDYPNWICTGCDIDPFQFDGTVDAPADGSEPLAGFKRADLVCTYEMVAFAVEDDANTSTEQDRYVTPPGAPGAEVSAEASYVGLPGGVLWYATSDGTVATGPAGTSIPFPVGFAEGKARFAAIWNRVPRALWGAGQPLFAELIGTETTRGYIGSLNSDAFMGYPALSLQLVGIEQRLLPDPTGLDFAWQLKYTFDHAVKPWGHLGIYYHDPATAGAKSGYYQVLRPAAGKTQIAAASIGDNDSLLPVRSFDNLFATA